MNKRLLSLTAAALAGMLMLSGCGSSASAEKESGKSGVAPEIQAIKDRGVVRVGVKIDVPKFGYKDPQTGNIEGFEIDLAKALAKKVIGDESKIELKGVNAKTRAALVDNGELDFVVATVTVTEERKKGYNFSDIYYTDGIGFLVKKDAGIKTFKDFNGKKIGVQQGSTTRKELQAEADKQGIKVTFLEFGTFPEVKAALDSGRVDGFSVDGAILAGYLDDSTMLLSERYTPQPYGVMAKKANEGLSKIINESVDDMKKSGELDKMLAKWGLKQ